jgi:hypothetical protein
MPARSDPMPILRSYFDALEAARFEEAAKCFTEGVFYSHPPFPGEGPANPRHEANGRQALIQLFMLRGKRPRRHRIDSCVVEGNHAFISGVSLNPPDPRSSFTSELKLSDDGLIDYYVTYSSVPGVGVTLETQT